jgi:mannose-6-phosphate isomerase
MSSTFQRPLQLNPRFSERPWGGNRLRGFLGKDAPTNGPAIGESWELSDHADGKSIVTSIDSTVNGLAFGEVVRRHPQEMIGREKAPATYPLLVKYLDAADNLSVQVHPDDEWCREAGHPDRGKSECWYVIDCAPGAQYRPWIQGGGHGGGRPTGGPDGQASRLAGPPADRAG